MLGSTTDLRYTRVAITLHWVIAVCIIGLLFVGLTMTTDGFYDKSTQYQLFQLHKSMGLTVLMLSFVRLAWRLTHRPPPLPATMKLWEKLAAHGTHWAFYALMFLLPLSGWALVSTSSWGLPTIWFGLFEWPHLPGLADLPNKEEANKAAGQGHEVFAWLAIALILMHVGAALKHHFVEKDDILTRMLPFLKPLTRKAGP